MSLSSRISGLALGLTLAAPAYARMAETMEASEYSERERDRERPQVHQEASSDLTGAICVTLSGLICILSTALPVAVAGKVLLRYLDQQRQLRRAQIATMTRGDLQEEVLRLRGLLQTSQGEITDLMTTRDDQASALQRLTGELQTAQEENVRLSQSIERLKAQLAGGLKGIKNAAALTEVTALLEVFQKMLLQSQARLAQVDPTSIAEGDRILIFAYNPDLVGLMREVKDALALLVEINCNPDLPPEIRVPNEALLDPLIEEFTGLERAAQTFHIREAFIGFLRLTGKLTILQTLLKREDFSEVPSEWWEDREAQIPRDFFEILGLETVAEWSQDLATHAAKAYRKIAQTLHPDKLGGRDPTPEEVQQLTLSTTAYDIFASAVETQRYLRFVARFIDNIPS